MWKMERQISVTTTISLRNEEDDDIFGQSPQDNETYDEKKWTRGHLRSQFETLELYKPFRKYTDKIGFGYFSLFLILTFFLFLTHSILLIVENYDNGEQLQSLVPDIVVYSVITFLSVTGLIFLELTQRRRKKWEYFCVIAFIVLFGANYGLPLYHDINQTADSYVYCPAYTFLVVISCYIFFGVSKNWVASLLGIFVSVVHILMLVFVTYWGNSVEGILRRIFSDIVFLICYNGLGIYFRYLNEIVQRKSFLDRRDCIANTFQLKHEKEQEEQLMASIIPAPLIDKVKEEVFRSMELHSKTGKVVHNNPFNRRLLETHEGVTILFADIVNYTVMTKKLNINSLLEVLNELFGRFDDASEKLKVIRIKFLGDCYYCVSGLPPTPPPNPAEACVDLGLKMIKIIADVREQNNLTIDMRIGIHTGKTISGIMGKIKYQFDIWSKDVDIANKMESEGEAGKVHITNKTKDLLKKPYDIQPTDKGEIVPQFKKYNIQTFLVTPISVQSQTEEESNSEPDDTLNNITPPRTSIFRKNGAPPILNQLHNNLDLYQISEEPRSTLTIIESNNLDKDLQARQTLTLANGEANGRRTTIYQRRASQRFRVNEDRRLTADVKRRTAFMSSNFKRYRERSAKVDQEMEKTIDNMSFSKKDQYVKEREISSLLIFRNKKKELDYVKMKDPMFKYYVLSQVGLILAMYLIQNFALDAGAWFRYEFLFSQFIIIFILLPSTWTYYLYLKYVTNFRESTPKNWVIRFFYNISRRITYNFWFRLGIYTLVWILFLFCVFIEVFYCHHQSINNPDAPDRLCLVPWHMTESCALALIMTFLFLKIFIWIKLLYALLTTLFYSLSALYFLPSLYKSSETFNPYLAPQISHILSIVFLTFTLHLIDRQTDYMNRLDFLWTTKLLEEKKKADEQQAVNTSMLINILPKHVAKIYLDVNKEMNDLYYETHHHAAVMFASIIFDEAYTEDENAFLTLMNEYITSIDTLINRKEFSKVEKIKIAKWTYMAACGLTTPGENDYATHEIETHPTYNSLYVLLYFASNMFKEFKKQNGLMHDIQLRIGISHGPIVAGVVGSKKPLYDIWGDAVNMASRMDSTGCPGKIHVLASTAQQIERLGYECEARGVTKVKGAGDVMTYFVKLDENFNLRKRKNFIYEE